MATNWKRENEKATKDLFQGKTYEELTQWSDFHARQYDAAVGRWFGVDPQNQFASPYTGMGNNPVMYMDPDGEWVHIAIGAVVGAVVGGIQAGTSGGNVWKGMGIGAGIGALAAFTGGAASAGITGGTLMSGGATMASGVAATTSVGSMVAGGAASGFVSGGFSSSVNGGSFFGGAWRGAVTGASGGFLAQFGGGSFASEVAWGAGTGAAVGALGAALNGGNIGQGALMGGAFGGGLAAGFATVQSLRNASDGYGFGTNDGRFNKMARGAVSGGVVNGARAQAALDFWTLRNGGPALNLGNGSTTSLAGRVNISSHEFINGVGDVRNTIAHELGHYYKDIAWANNQPSGVSLNRWNDNTNAFGGDGSLGYNYAIKHAGRFHVGLGATSHSPTNNFVGAAWRQYPRFNKWWSLLPRRF